MSATVHLCSFMSLSIFFDTSNSFVGYSVVNQGKGKACPCSAIDTLCVRVVLPLLGASGSVKMSSPCNGGIGGKNKAGINTERSAMVKGNLRRICKKGACSECVDFFPLGKALQQSRMVNFFLVRNLCFASALKTKTEQARNQFAAQNFSSILFIQHLHSLFFVDCIKTKNRKVTTIACRNQIV